jgi:hypothetical protein
LGELLLENFDLLMKLGAVVAFAHFGMLVFLLSEFI